MNDTTTTTALIATAFQKSAWSVRPTNHSNMAASIGAGFAGG
jgi:hypothetical protein